MTDVITSLVNSVKSLSSAFQYLSRRVRKLEVRSSSNKIDTILTIEDVLIAPDMNPLRVHNKWGMMRTISEVMLSVNTAPTGAEVIVDVHKNGVTIFTDQANRPRIIAGAYEGTTITIDVPEWADGEYLQVEVDQVGSVVAGSYLVVHIIHA